MRRQPLTPQKDLLVLQKDLLVLQKDLLVLLSVTEWFNLKTMVQLEGLGQFKNPIISSGIEPATFQLVA
jgi:hypothetical protein